MENELINYVRISHPLLWVKTHEEDRVLQEYVAQIKDIKVPSDVAPYQSYVWDIVEGIRSCGIKNGSMAYSAPIKDTAMEPKIPLEWLEKTAPENTILFLKDYHPYIKEGSGPSIFLTRNVRNLAATFKCHAKILVIVSPIIQIPQELTTDFKVIEFKLPTREELKIVLQSVCETSGSPYPRDKDEALFDAALGMSAHEADRAFSLSLVEAQKFDPAIVRREKAAIVKTTGLLEVVETTTTMADIGGLENLKEWLGRRKNCVSTKAKNFGAKAPKGALIVGVPGGGKSLTAKAVAGMFGWTLLRMDVSNIFGSLVGQSEANMKSCLTMAEAISPCILWMDEIEKGITGGKDGMDSHEVSKHVLQILLTWMQETKATVFVMATANSIKSIPDALLRRFNAIYWVDFPDAVQRAEIIRIMLRKNKRKPDMFDKSMEELVKACEGFTGAEIEKWVEEAILLAFDKDHEDITLQDLLDTTKEITPISSLSAAEIDEARREASKRNMKQASSTHDVPVKASSKARKIV